MLYLFGAAIFLSALLLFMVQPMAAKALLPLLGGSPAVWNTCMVFFQALLLAGYAYAHGVSKIKGKWAQVGIHAAVILAAAAFLPIAAPRNVSPPATGQALWLLGLLGTMVAGPFFVLSTTGPLVQSWFARTGHPAAKDPYFLYAASNAGSFLGLLGYPLVVEAVLGLRGQGVAWAWGYAVLAPLLIACGIVMARAIVVAPTRQAKRSGRVAAPETPPADSEPVTWGRRWWWVFLAFVPSSLVLGTTQYVTTDIAAIPLLWVVPLSIYLLTFIIAFSKKELIGVGSLSKLLPFVVIALAVAFLLRARQPVGVIVSLHVLMLFMGALLCHKRLADARPGVSHLTEFYLWIAVGGVLGGIFNALVAPVVFNDVVEYPLAIGLACLARVRSGKPSTTRQRALDLIIPALITAFAVGIYPALVAAGRAAKIEIIGGYLIDFLRIGLPCILCFLVVMRPLRFGLSIVGVLVYSLYVNEQGYRVIHQERTFFGVLRVMESEQGRVHTLRHGTTTHGSQIMIEELRRMPTVYYHPDGPLGDIMYVYRDKPVFDRIAVIGMGTGAIAAYGRPGMSIDFYEIDPAVDRIARDTNWFSYLADSKADDVNVIIGDGRLEFAKAPDNSYGLIVVDAFSSDAIPVHLITLEAVEIYASKLREDGILAFHISNRHIALNPPLIGIADRLGLAIGGCVFREPHHRIDGPWTSVWMVMARDREHLKALVVPEPDDQANRLRWDIFMATRETPVWTDDHANVLEMFKW